MTLPAMPWVPEISIGCFRQSWGPKADSIDRNVGRARVLLSRARLKSLPTETCTHKQGEGDVQPRPHDLHDSEKSKGKLSTLGRGMCRELVDKKSQIGGGKNGDRLTFFCPDYLPSGSQWR